MVGVEWTSNNETMAVVDQDGVLVVLAPSEEWADMVLGPTTVTATYVHGDEVLTDSIDISLADEAELDIHEGPNCTNRCDPEPIDPDEAEAPGAPGGFDDMP